MSYKPNNPNGQATMANSEPVVLASDQASIPVTVSGVSTAANQTTIIGHLDGVEGLLTTIDADTGNISTKIDTIAGAVAGTEMQVDVLTMPTTTVQATNLDIRDLTQASDSVLIYGSDDGGTTKRVIKTDAGGAIQVDLEVASVAITSIAAGDNNIGNVDIVSSALPTGASTLAEQQSQTTHLATIAGDTTSIQTAVELIDDTVYTDGSGTVTKGIAILGQDGTNPQAIKTDASGELQVDVLTMPTVAVTQSGTWDEVGINDSGNSITVDNGGTFAVQVDGAALTALQLIDDIVYTDDTSTHATGTSKGALIMAAAAPTDTAVNANDIGAVGMTVNRELYVSLTTALPAGTNGIGKLTANSGVDIGDVDVTSISAGSNLIGDVGIQPRTTNGLDTMNATSSDGATALTSTVQAIKASAGKLYGYYIYNPNSSAQFVQFYNTASGSVTVGTTNPLFMLTIPATAGANLISDIGITFGTAMSWAATSTAGGNGAPTTALDAVAWYK